MWLNPVQPMGSTSLESSGFVAGGQGELPDVVIFGVIVNEPLITFQSIFWVVGGDGECLLFADVEVMG